VYVAKLINITKIFIDISDRNTMEFILLEPYNLIKEDQQQNLKIEDVNIVKICIALDLHYPNIKK